MFYIIIMAVICFAAIVGIYNVYYEIKKKNYTNAILRLVIYAVLIVVAYLILRFVL